MKDEPEFAFQKKIFINDDVGDYLHSEMLNHVARLWACLRETNRECNLQCESFRLDFRPANALEQMRSPLPFTVLDMRWGSLEEVDKKAAEALFDRNRTEKNCLTSS